MVERRPEEAGVVGSIPTLDTIYIIINFMGQELSVALIKDNDISVQNLGSSEFVTSVMVIMLTLYSRYGIRANQINVKSVFDPNWDCDREIPRRCTSKIECRAAGKCLHGT